MYIYNNDLNNFICSFKLRNIEETEAAKKLLQEKRLMGSRTKSDFSIPSSYTADYFQRGRDYAEKLRRGFFLFFFLAVFITNMTRIRASPWLFLVDLLTKSLFLFLFNIRIG